MTKKNIEAKRAKMLPVDAIISSSAWRCKMTADVAAKALDYDRNTILYDARLWIDDYTKILDCIAALSNDWNTVVLVWHNSTLSDAMNALTQQDVGSIPKSGFVCQTFACSLRAWVNKNSRHKQRKYFWD